MKRVATTLISIFALFAVLAFLMGKVYKTGQDRPPLKYALIPDSTLKHLKHISESGGESSGIVVIEGGGGGESWKNDDDPGNAEGANWSKEEDPNFIVYYHRDKDAVWQGRAQNILRCANNNIEPLADLMGHYVYPSEVNGRKLAIYLPTSTEEYISLCSQLLGRPATGLKSSIGVTITSISMYGCRTEGILIRNSCFEDRGEHNQYPNVLLHEMNHYVYRSVIDYSQVIDHKNWQIEGTADFICGDDYSPYYATSEDRANFIDKQCDLRNDFPNETNAQYWAGSAFLFYLEKTYGRDFVKSFIHESYKKKTEQVFTALGLSVDEEHTKWVEYERSKQNP